MNSKGHSNSLQPEQWGNRNALKHGVNSPRTLCERAAEISAWLMASWHTIGLDQLAADEIGSIISLVEAIDRDLLEHGLTNKKGEARSLLDLRVRLSGRLERWLTVFGATPASRLAWVDTSSRADAVANAVREELAEGARLLAEARDRGDVPEAPGEQQ